MLMMHMIISNMIRYMIIYIEKYKRIILFQELNYILYISHSFLLNEKEEEIHMSHLIKIMKGRETKLMIGT